jgi:cell division protein ZapA
MATVNVMVNGRAYSVGCEDGQEAHVEALAREFDRQVQDVSAQVGQVGDLRLFLMAALMGMDEVADARVRIAHMQSQLAGRQADRNQDAARAAEAVSAAAQRIEALAARLDLDGAAG